MDLSFSFIFGSPIDFRVEILSLPYYKTFRYKVEWHKDILLTNLKVQIVIFDLSSYTI